MMTNPYATPAAKLAMDETRHGIESFKRFSAWYVLGLAIITFSLYMIYWLYTRTKTLNKLTANPISAGFCIVTAVLGVVGLVASFVEGFAQGWLGSAWQGSVIAGNFMVFSNVINIVSNLLILVWVFKFRNRLADDVIGGLSGRSEVGLVMTFFFQIIYLQYKINRKIDEAPGVR